MLTIDERIEIAKHHPGQWCRVGRYASRGARSNGLARLRARRLDDGLTYNTHNDTTGHYVWVRWDGPKPTVPAPEPDELFQLADSVPDNEKPAGPPSFQAAAAAIERARLTPGRSVKIATYGSPGAAWHAAHKTFPKEYPTDVTFKNTSRNREHAVWATWSS